jgi:hypothetical protein
MRSALITVTAAAALLAGCGGGTHQTATAPSPHTSASATTSAAAPAGCQQAALHVAAISSHLQQSPGDSGQAFHQLKALGKGLPLSTLKVDVDRAVLDIALFRQYVLLGGPAASAAKRFAADLKRIQAYCA